MARPSVRLLPELLPLIILTIIGCGSPGAPAPPSLNLPTPVKDLTASRTDESVNLDWTMPARTTDRLALKRPIPTQICRAIESGPCTTLTSLSFDPGKPAHYTDVLSVELANGPARLLTYKVDLRNHAQKSAGPSNSAFTAAGASPPPVIGLTAQSRRDGVLLTWHASVESTPGTQSSKPAAILFRIKRVRQNPPTSGTKDSNSPASTPDVQVLGVRSGEGVDPGHALDTNAAFNQLYQYTVQRVATLNLAGHEVEIAGKTSDPAPAPTNDIFPPAVPQGVAAVADSAGGAIDLSWTPDTDQDLAGYIVYRRDVASGMPAQPISPPGLKLTVPSFRDTQVESGHTYAYSVIAIDKSGNPSAPSQESTETLSAK